MLIGTASPRKPTETPSKIITVVPLKYRVVGGRGQVPLDLSKTGQNNTSTLVFTQVDKVKTECSKLWRKTPLISSIAALKAKQRNKMK